MKVCHTLICCFFLAVQDGVTVSSQNIREVKEGENITVSCSFTLSGTRKYFCKNECEDRNVLIETTDNEAQNGRYSIEYKGRSFLTSPILYVSITQLTKSDSGWYRCGLGRIYFSDGSEDFEIFVTDASVTSTPKSTSAFSTSTFLPSASTTTTTTNTTTTTTTTTTTQSVSSSSGGSTPSSPSSSSGPGLLLYVGLILIVMLVILSAALLIFWRRRRVTKPRGISGPPVETEYADVREVNLEYEEIREDGRRRPPPAYTSVKFTKTNAADGADDDNFVVQ